MNGVIEPDVVNRAVARRRGRFQKSPPNCAIRVWQMNITAAEFRAPALAEDNGMMGLIRVINPCGGR